MQIERHLPFSFIAFWVFVVVFAFVVVFVWTKWHGGIVFRAFVIVFAFVLVFVKSQVAWQVGEQYMGAMSVVCDIYFYVFVFVFAFVFASGLEGERRVIGSDVSCLCSPPLPSSRLMERGTLAWEEWKQDLAKRVSFSHEKRNNWEKD